MGGMGLRVCVSCAVGCCKWYVTCGESECGCVECCDLRGAELAGDGRAAPGAPPGPGTRATAAGDVRAGETAGAAAGEADDSATERYNCERSRNKVTTEARPVSTWCYRNIN